MKKIFVFLLVIFSFLTTFVSAQDTTKTLKEVVFNFDTITLLKGDNPPQDRAGHYELSFSTQPGIIFFRDVDKGEIMKITLGAHVLDQAIVVLYKKEKVPATVMCFNAEIRGYDVTFATVVLDDKEKTIFAFGITLENYSIMMKVKDK
jgi:hypothetical protein